jgi:hypothetical protein
MNAGEAYEFVNYLANRASSGGFIPPGQFTMLMQRAEDEFVSKYYNNVKQYSKGDPTALYAFGDTQRVRDNLRPYKKTYSFGTLAGGTAQLPSDYLHPIGFFATYRYTTPTYGPKSLDCGNGSTATTTTSDRTVEVKLLEDDEYGIRLGSTIKPPTNEYPIARFSGNTAYFAPSTTLLPILHYIKKPSGARFGYTLNADGDPVYDPSTSQSWEAPTDCHNELVEMILQYVGIHVNGEMTTEFARYKENTGI